MEIVVAIAAKVAEYVVAPVGRQFGYIICYKNNVQSLKTQVHKLEEAKHGVQHSVDAAKRHGEEIEVNVQNWIIKVDDIVDEAKRLQDNVGHANVGCCYLWPRHQLSRKAKNLAQGVSEILAERNFNTISHRETSLRTQGSTSVRGYKALGSRASMLKEIMQALEDATLYMIGLYGMGGVGKSSLAKELAWQAEQDGSYDAVVMATVSNSLDVKRIQGQLADGLDLKFDEETEVGRAHRLCRRIRKEKSILIILDDIWQNLDLTDIGVPFGDDHRGSKLLLISRNLDVLNCQMGTQIEFKLDVLDEEESWSLFEKMAGDAVKDINLQATAFEVARCCSGLPLLIVTVAKALKNKDLYAWKDALKQLARSNHDELRKSVYSALELSYNSLETDELKSLFMFLGSIGQNAIGTNELLIYGWGLGIYKHVDTLADARNRLYKLINSLKASCLLLEGGEEWVQMHDVVRDIAASIASSHEPAFAMQRYTALKEWPEIDWLKICDRIFLPWCNIHELPEILECPELKILVLASKGNFLKVPENFFARMRKLKVLVLGGLYCSPSSHLSLCFLTNLRALYLYQCMLEDISIVAEFPNLEILSLKKSEISELPREIGLLTHLRLLDLSDCSSLRVIPANLLSSLTRLEELYMGNCFFQWEVEGSKNQNKNASLSELRHLHRLTALEIQIQDASVLPRDLLVFGKLENYKIFIGDAWKWPGKYRTSRTLKLGATFDSLLDHGVKLLLNRVEDLYIAQLKCIRNVLGQLNREGFPLLKHLNIQNNSEMQYIINSIEWVHLHQAFPNLESLVIHNLTNLEKLCRGPLPRQSFSKLKTIKVIGCDRLPSLFLCSMVKDLSQLVQIEISECKFMTEIITEQRQEDYKGLDKITFPKLRSLTLHCLPMLVTFYSKPLTSERESRNCAIEHNDDLSLSIPLFSEKVAFPSLETLKLSSIKFGKISDDQVLTHSCFQSLRSLVVDDCGTSNYLFSCPLAKRLARLQYLEIRNCEMVDRIFAVEENTGKLPSSEEVLFPNLETFVISHMDNLQSIWPHRLPPNSFCKLKKMEVKFCKNLLNLFPSYVVDKLQNLETLLSTNCAALEFVFGTQGLNMGGTSQGGGVAIPLRTLTLNHLPRLKDVWSKDTRGILKFQNLCTVEAVECESLDYVFPLSIANELWQLQRLEIRDCGGVEVVTKDEVADASPPRFVFPQLTSLTFWNLSELRSFYPGVHTLDCPILRKLDVYHCDKLEVFTSKSQSIQGDVPVNQQSFFSVEKDIAYLEELSLSSKDVTMICNGQLGDDFLHRVKVVGLQCFHDESSIFPWDFLKTFTNLEKLTVSCSSFTEIFSIERYDYLGTITQLRGLELEYLKKLKYICDEKSRIQSILQNLETLEVIGCSSLKNLVPSSVLFQNLDSLFVSSCGALVNLVSSSTARNLLNLRTMAIHECEMIEEIVGSEDGEGSEIAFMKLECLVLLKLPRLTSFCKGNYSFKFPLLKELLVSNCPRMQTFSQGILRAPSLRKVFVMAENDGWHWEGDLNATIRKIFNQTVCMH